MFDIQSRQCRKGSGEGSAGTSVRQGFFFVPAEPAQWRVVDEVGTRRRGGLGTVIIDANPLGGSAASVAKTLDCRTTPPLLSITVSQILSPAAFSSTNSTAVLGSRAKTPLIFVMISPGLRPACSAALSANTLFTTTPVRTIFSVPGRSVNHMPKYPRPAAKAGCTTLTRQRAIKIFGIMGGPSKILSTAIVLLYSYNNTMKPSSLALQNRGTSIRTQFRGQISERAARTGYAQTAQCYRRNKQRNAKGRETTACQPNVRGTCGNVRVKGALSA